MTSYSPALAGALAYAAAHDVVIVAAAGNSGTSTPIYPAADPNVLAVAATDAGDHKAAFSSYGPYVAVSAPGVSIISPYYDGGYALWSGTSMSAPFVSGAAAVWRALNVGDNRDDIGQRIQRSVVAINSLNPLFAGGLGSGRIDFSSAAGGA